MRESAKKNSFNPSNLKKGEILIESGGNPFQTFDEMGDKIFPERGKSLYKVLNEATTIDPSKFK